MPVLVALPAPDPPEAATPLEARSDDDLLLLTRGGVNAAFAVLVRRHQARALRVACKELRDPELAADAVQQTFLELFRYLPRYRPQGKLRSLLYRVLLNQIGMTRRRLRWRSRELPLDATALAGPQVKTADRPDELILELEKSREVERCLAKLSEKLRVVLRLRFSADLTVPEIAAALGVAEGTVKSRLAAGVSRLRELLCQEAT